MFHRRRESSFRAAISAATSSGWLVLGFLLVRIILVSVKPAALNSFRKVPLSSAPEIQENQSSAWRILFFFSGPVNTSSAA